jgi:hypothetical protein
MEMQYIVFGLTLRSILIWKFNFVPMNVLFKFLEIKIYYNSQICNSLKKNSIPVELYRLKKSLKIPKKWSEAINKACLGWLPLFQYLLSNWYVK